MKTGGNEVSVTDQPQTAEPIPADPSAADLAPELPVADPAATTAPDEQKEQAIARKSRAWLLWVFVAAVLILSGIGSVMWWEWTQMGLPNPLLPSAPPPSVNAAAAAPDMALRDELAALQARLSALETRQATNNPTADLTALGNRLGQTESALQSLQSQPKLPATLIGDVDALHKAVEDMKRTSADAATVLRLLDRVEKAESQIRDLQNRRTTAGAMLLAVGQLRDAVARAMPYDDEWRSVHALAPQDGELQTALQSLKARTIIGIPTITTLVMRFDQLAPALVRADILPNDQSWWRRSLDRLSNLVLIRRQDALAEGNSAAAIVARADAALKTGDLKTATQDLAALSPAAAAIAAPWLADAAARLQADSALSILTAQTIAAVGAMAAVGTGQ